MEEAPGGKENSHTVGKENFVVALGPESELETRR